MTGFPTEAIPDGTVAVFHHLYTGVFAALLFAATTWDDPTELDWATGTSLEGIATDPVGVITGGGVSVGLFALGWPHYPVFGAAGTLFGLAVASLSLARPYWRHYRGRAIAVGLGLLIAWDDAIDHAFPVSTPLDVIWANYIFPYMA